MERIEAQVNLERDRTRQLPVPYVTAPLLDSTAAFLRPRALCDSQPLAGGSSGGRAVEPRAAFPGIAACSKKRGGTEVPPL